MAVQRGPLPSGCSAHLPQGNGPRCTRNSDAAQLAQATNRVHHVTERIFARRLAAAVIASISMYVSTYLTYVGHDHNEGMFT